MRLLKFLFILILFLFLFPQPAVAAVTPCDPVSGVPCTYCITEGSGCRVDFNMSSCNISGYSPDSSVCSTLNSFCNDGHPSGNCLAAPVCGGNGSSCTGTGQGTCCDGLGLICTNGTCVTQATCKNINEQCPGPAGTAGGCCSPLQCQVYAGGGQNLKCQNPPNPITGYFCEMSGFQCLPCHSGDTNSGCKPPQYGDYNSCHLACTGQVPVRFSCTNNQCVETQGGQYPNIGDCMASGCENISCNNVSNSEFHSLRPYPGKPCLTAISETATFCGDSLTLTDNIKITYNPGTDNCVSIPGGKVRCTYSVNKNRNITIDLSEAELPIMGNTEDVTPNASPDMPDAQKVNEYVSWYLNGVINRKEYPEKTDNASLVNFSGPINKLLPQEIQLAKRVEQVENATGVDLGSNQESIQQDRHNQIAVCTKEIEIPILGIKIGRASPTKCSGGFNIQADYRLGDWNGDLSFWNNILNNVLGGIGNIVDFFAKMFPNYALTDIAKYLSDSEAWNKRVPPFSWNPQFKDDQLLYRKAYNEWLGKSCILIPVPIRFLVCIENIFVPNKYADLIPYVPLSSTEDREGEVTASGSVGSAPGVTINNVSTSFTSATLYFAHMQETTELSSTLQDTFIYKGADKFAAGNSVPVSITGSCKTVDVRSNPGDNLLAAPTNKITGNIAYTATFTCDFNAVSSSSCSGTCVPNRLECTDAGGTPGTGSCGGKRYCCNFSTPKPQAEQSCTKVIPITIATTTETPLADKIWAQLVSGTSSVFRKIFPKLGSGSQIGEVKDIPASTKVEYSGDVSGTGELKFPHIGGISEYFLKGIQTMLRPKGYGEAISFGETTNAVCAPGSSRNIPDLPSAEGTCKLTSTSISGITLPPTLVSIFEAAAQSYHIPPGLILGVMFGEGAFNPGRYDWTEDNVKKWSMGCASMPGCSPDSFPSTGVVPFYENYWNQLEDAVNIVDPNREPNPCNLLDAIFALAKDLNRSQNGSAAFAGKTCYGVALNAGGGGSGSCSWDSSDYETAIRVWEFGTAYNSTYTCATKPGSCATGGGGAAACPGGDLCETVGESGNTSHNACVWIVAHSH